MRVTNRYRNHNEALKKNEESKREIPDLQGRDTYSHEGKEKNIYNKCTKKCEYKSNLTPHHQPGTAVYLGFSETKALRSTTTLRTGLSLWPSGTPLCLNSFTL